MSTVLVWGLEESKDSTNGHLQPLYSWPLNNMGWTAPVHLHMDFFFIYKYIQYYMIHGWLNSQIWNPQIGEGQLRDLSTVIFWYLLVGPGIYTGFPGSSAGKESNCNVADPGSIPGSGRSPGEGIGYQLQYSWASLVAQMVKNLPAVRKTCVWSLGC